MTVIHNSSLRWFKCFRFRQVFYWSHTLYVPYWILLFIHGPIFWYFFIVPGAVFVVERCYMSKAFKLAKYGRVFIAEVNLLPSRVIHSIFTSENLLSMSSCIVFLCLLYFHWLGHTRGDYKTRDVSLQTWRLHLHQYSSDCQTRVASLYHQQLSWEYQ